MGSISAVALPILRLRYPEDRASIACQAGPDAPISRVQPECECVRPTDVRRALGCAYTMTPTRGETERGFQVLPSLSGLTATWVTAAWSFPLGFLLGATAPLGARHSLGVTREGGRDGAPTTYGGTDHHQAREGRSAAVTTRPCNGLSTSAPSLSSGCPHKPSQELSSTGGVPTSFSEATSSSNFADRVREQTITGRVSLAVYTWMPKRWG